MLWQEKIALWNDKNLKYLKSLFPVRKSPDQLLTPIPEEKIEKPPEYFIRKLKPFANLGSRADKCAEIPEPSRKFLELE